MHYTTRMKNKALNLIAQGKSLAEVRGYIEATSGKGFDPNQYVGMDLDLADYVDGYGTGIDSRSSELELLALSGR